MLDVLTAAHWEEKFEPKRPVFCLRSEIRVSLNERGGPLFMMDQYELASLLSVIISEQYLEYVFNCSLFIIDGFA